MITYYKKERQWSRFFLENFLFLTIIGNALLLFCLKLDMKGLKNRNNKKREKRKARAAR